jgi:hypothetical protein
LTTCHIAIEDYRRRAQNHAGSETASDDLTGSHEVSTTGVSRLMGSPLVCGAGVITHRLGRIADGMGCGEWFGQMELQFGQDVGGRTERRNNATATGE